ncbi:hypothetical protein [Chitinophaga sp. XS-30]|uniref:hypothetical protein n=1 Tax=Chitinophaga sp. XS-30 TaxID=2604421 RepID=UPI0011DCCD7E|nr:hypothetical protein [Chitinophaga sp. XS-30]QEH42959.1 hypothetical protein FW415_19630 [Chitinophaga sp. XS-30]
MNKEMQTFKQFKEELEKNSELQNEFKEDPLKAVQQFEPKNPRNDVWVYRLVVSALGAAILLIILGVVVLMLNDSVDGDGKLPTIFTAIGSGAIGALAGLLAPAPQRAE